MIKTPLDQNRQLQAHTNLDDQEEVVAAVA
jgi:hypothetical protein